MIDLPFSSATGRLDARFSVGMLLPCLVFSVLGAAALVLGRGTRRSAAWWQTLGTPGQALMVTAGLCLTLLIAWVLAGQTTALLYAAAGHWPGPLGSRPARWGRSRYLRRFAHYREKAASDPRARELLYFGFAG